jgi:prepilin-type N-terminal cleavage/methylation domain-containing protein
LNRRGFTLFEILVTILIFSLGVLVLAGTQVLSTKGTAFNQEATTAALIGQKKIEELKGTAFDSIVDGNGTEQGMLVSWSVASEGISPHRLKDITVTVEWNLKRITLSTVIGE